MLRNDTGCVLNLTQHVLSLKHSPLVIDRYRFFITDTDTDYLHFYVPDNQYAEPIFIYFYTSVFDTIITTQMNRTNNFIYNNHSLLAYIKKPLYLYTNK